MTLFYSATTNGFFDDAIHTTMPDDVVTITAEQHRQLFQAQATGMVILADASGHPIAAQPVAPSREALIDAARQQCEQLLSASDKYMIPDYPISPAKREEWRSYRQALRDLRESITDPDTINWPTEPAKEDA